MQAMIAVNPQLELSSPDDIASLRRRKSLRKIDTIKSMKPKVGKQAIDLLKPQIDLMGGLYTKQVQSGTDSFIVSGERKRDQEELSDDGVTSNDSMSDGDEDPQNFDGPTK